MTVCSRCGKRIRKPNYISLFYEDKYICWNCHKPKFKIDGILTRTSDRVREQQKKYAADFIQPHTYDKSKRKLVISSDFIKLYPDKIKYYATEEQVRKEGYPKLAEVMKKQKEIEKQAKEKIQIEYEGKEEVIATKLKWK